MSSQNALFLKQACIQLKVAVSPANQCLSMFIRACIEFSHTEYLNIAFIHKNFKNYTEAMIKRNKVQLPYALAKCANLRYRIEK